MWKARKIRSIRSIANSFALQRDQIISRLLNQLPSLRNELLVQGVHSGAPVSTAA